MQTVPRVAVTAHVNYRRRETGAHPASFLEKAAQSSLNFAPSARAASPRGAN
jgi:hypothetical protein